MDSTSVGDLEQAFASAEVPTTRERGRCGLCECSLEGAESIVEVALPESEGPTALLCSSCYEHLVGEVGVTPIQVFKSGSRRRVVLPSSLGGPD